MSPPELLTAPAPGSETPAAETQVAPRLTVPALRPSSPRRRPGRLRYARYFAGGGLVLLLGWAGLTWGLPGRSKTAALTAPAARGDLVLTVTERGELESSKSTTLNCEVEGGVKLATIVPEGTHVTKGQEIARFDTDILQKGINEQEVKWETADGKMKAAEAELETARDKGNQEVGKADNALELAEITLKAYTDGEYKVEVEKRKAELDLAKKELKEAEDALQFARDLVKKGFGQLEDVRAKELNADSKKAKARQMEADLDHLQVHVLKQKTVELGGKLDDARREAERAKKGLKSSVDKATSELNAAKKTAELEKRELERLQKQLEKCVVTAPQDGIVIYAKRYYWDDATEIRPGAQLMFQQPLVTLPDLDKMQVKMRVHESVVKKVQKGQTATLQIEALPGVLLHGKVVSVATQAQSQGWRSSVKEYETVISVDDLPADAGLRPGMTAEVKVLLKVIPAALTVPVQAVTEYDGKHVCYVDGPDGPARREVEVGEGNDQHVQVLAGLDEGERVALDARLRAAAELKVSEGKDRPKDKDEPKKEQPAQ